MWSSRMLRAIFGNNAARVFTTVGRTSDHLPVRFPFNAPGGKLVEIVRTHPVIIGTTLRKRRCGLRAPLTETV